MQSLARVCSHDSQVLLATPYRMVDVTNPVEVDAAVDWWTEHTENGGEGSTGKLRNGPDTGTRESHSAWWRAMDILVHPPIRQHADERIRNVPP